MPRTTSAPPGGAALPLLASGATFLAMLDATVTNLAIADLRHDFTSASVAGLTWVITLYAVLFAALLAPAGRLADIVGRRLLFRSGVAVFTGASLLCALAPSLPMLLAARALQGAGAAAMIPASLAVLLHDTPADRRARAIGLWTASGAMAAAVGPSVGGVLVDLLHWRSLFFINIPVGLAIIVWARVIPAGERTHGRLPDLFGTALLAGGIGAIALGVTQGPSWHWDDARTIGLLAGGTAGTALALWRSTTHPVPAVETSLWRSRTFAVANIASALYGAALYPWLLVGVLYLTQVWHYSELRAGLAVSPGALTATIAALALGRFGGRFGPRAGVVGGAAVMAGSAIWIVLALPVTPQFLTFWLPVGLVGGAGMGALTYGAASAAALSVTPLRFAGATGLNTTARQLGGALGVAALAAILPARTGLQGFTNVYLFCALVSAAAAVIGMAITLRAAPAAVPASTRKEEVTA
ncbi:MFS transporter [Sphaerisporangium perillae]|uniref:MFS transporter n=1 Tax=Sphaerisporangium perillae TaxID=2935860 RepID=UPI00200F7AB2|nr:MFS transporter [Sphaerisporangium perillae]